jgi:hypothetical protein
MNICFKGSKRPGTGKVKEASDNADQGSKGDLMPLAVN